MTKILVWMPPGPVDPATPPGTEPGFEAETDVLQGSLKADPRGNGGRNTIPRMREVRISATAHKHLIASPPGFACVMRVLTSLRDTGRREKIHLTERFAIPPKAGKKTQIFNKSLPKSTRWGY